jgi:hypothetical protein
VGKGLGEEEDFDKREEKSDTKRGSRDRKSGAYEVKGEGGERR